MIKRVTIGLLILIALGIAGFVIWGSTPLGPMAEAEAALQDDAEVAVDEEPWLVFRPVGQPSDTGLILYPGGRVDPRSYAPAARAIAARGYLMVIVPMPLNLAVLDAGRAADVMAAFPEIQHWAVGGHSLGGAMAASFAHQNRDRVEGLVLWAAYPASNTSLADQDLKVVSIYATVDGLATGDKIEASRPLLPVATHWVAVQGGNHAQFGWYGSQAGDRDAEITRHQQQAQVIEATTKLLAALKEKGVGETMPPPSHAPSLAFTSQNDMVHWPIQHC